VEYEDRCADSTVFTSFDYTTASNDINDFCKGGVNLLPIAEPIWNTYDHKDKEMSLHLAIQWTQRDGDQDGCNPYQNSDHISEKDCIEQFLAAMNRCNKDTVEKKYGQYPMTWNSPGGCVDLWLIGHEGLDKWNCDKPYNESEECQGKRKGT
jgi:hypothetical protein